MSNYTVIKADTAIYKDGDSTFSCDMSGLPDDFHALQWDGTNGEIEYIGNVKPNLVVSSKSQIESALSVSLPTLIERRDTRIAEIVVEKAVAAEAAAAKKAAENE
tara:strand:+ start:790 stop:1104 length:315 start_codon:yes stop_codon:yes gene_type:complete